MGKLRCKVGLFAQGCLERYCRDQQRPLNKKKKKNYCTLAFLVAPLVTAGHSSWQNQAGMRGQSSTKGQWHTCSGNVATLGLTILCVSLSLFSMCSFTARAIALILCPGLQGDSHEQWGFWAGDHHLRKCNSPGTFVVFLDTYLLAKQDMETRCEPCGCTSYLSTSLPTASWHERAC